MGCKQYARMLGLSRGYPYILYLSLSKWDAAPLPWFFHKADFGPRAKVGGTMSRATRICMFEFPGRQVAAQISEPSRQHLGSGRGPALQIRNGKISPVQQGPLLNGGTHGYVNILKNFTGRDSLRAVGGFHKIVASLTAMFTPERIPELQGTGELPGSDQKSRPIDLPFAFCFPHFIPPLGEGRLLEFGCRQNAVSLAGFSVKVKKNLRAIGGAVNPKFRCKCEIFMKEFELPRNEKTCAEAAAAELRI